ncbi:MAG TPA: bifunctional DNA-formamidopyrimidine glycosylase/DNA-(apurinic or apyrimidinic site) lyase [Fimbriiglobus sp.]|jgi:formamidopyrimidine-DNA glycosylase
MPELPEVETVVRDLRPMLVGREIRHVRVGKQKLRRPWKSAWSRLLVAARVESVRRRGKWILITFAGGRTLLSHLGMTGQLTVADAKSASKDHTHLTFLLNDGRELRFRDVRRFGSADLFSTPETLDHFLTARLGPEPFDVTAEEFRSVIRPSTRCLKALLLDQSRVAGVGNIYADEACFRSKLHPARRGNTLTDAECDRLRTAVVEVLTRAVEGRGSTIRDYVGGSGLMGTYQGEFCVYGRTGEPCPNCCSAIEMVRLAGRSSHYCPKCQQSGSGRRGLRPRGGKSMK